MRHLIKKITNPLLKRLYQWYYAKPRKYNYKNCYVWVYPGIFPPHYTISTKLLLDLTSKIDLKNKSFLELGCGSGIISIFAAKKGAIVTATDINKNALKEIHTNLKLNNVSMEVIYSDLFENIPETFFDFIIINPPYYPRNPKNDAEKAWFCGENFDYFKSLFFQIKVFLKNNSQCFIILSEDCQLITIKNLAHENNIDFNLIFYKKVFFEKNYIYSLKIKS